MNWFKKCPLGARFLLPAALALLGAAAGYCYYRFIGCASGACAIASNPYLSTIYGGVLGLLVGFLIAPNRRAG